MESFFLGFLAFIKWRLVLPNYHKWPWLPKLQNKCMFQSLHVSLLLLLSWNWNSSKELLFAGPAQHKLRPKAKILNGASLELIPSKLRTPLAYLVPYCKTPPLDEPVTLTRHNLPHGEGVNLFSIINWAFNFHNHTQQGRTKNWTFEKFYFPTFHFIQTNLKRGPKAVALLAIGLSWPWLFDNSPTISSSCFFKSRMIHFN